MSIGGAAICEFTVPGKPVSWARAGRNGRVTFTQPKQRKHMDLIQRHAFDAMGGDAPYGGPVRAIMTFCFPIAASWPKKNQQDALNGMIQMTARPDCDNLSKVVLDSLNGLVFDDDAQVIDLRITKAYSAHPMTMVRIEPA